MNEEHEHYYVPESSYWPILATIGITTLLIGAIRIFQDLSFSWPVFFTGALIFAFVLYGWFSNVISESQNGLYSKQMDRTFRWGMAWFIFSEVMFFAAFFGALLYIREFAIPWLGGEGERGASNMLWEGFKAHWPLLENPNPEKFINPRKEMGWWPLPLINTIILLTSGATVTWAHHALKDNNRKSLNIGLALTVMLGALFVCLQAYEYIHAYEELGLKLNSGSYGTTFFMLTGFHGAHVTLGTIMLFVILLRCIKGHFKPEGHFAFEATAWYWHFVDVVWLFLFIFVYCF